MRVLIAVSPASDGPSRFSVRLDSETGDEVDSGELTPLDPPADLLRRFENSHLNPGAVKEMGRHLFDRLIGAAAWEQICGSAAERATTSIELALSWPSSENYLHRLPWETLHDGRTFLGAHPELSIAVTRVVTDAVEVACPAPVVAPARVLFVLGAELTDPDIRPGAEVIGLLRGVKGSKGAINASFVEDATLLKVAERCRRFEPHIVHFISHGGLDDAGRGELKLQPSEPDDTGWVTGERLLRALRAAEHPPLLAVLTGCKSAAAGEHMDPLAAELVCGGIPSVIGMAGEISDPVCRLFSREFGRALNTGMPLVEAMTEGRRAGLQRQEDRADDDHAWALPSIYLAPNVPPEHAPIDAVGAAAAFDRVDQYELGEGPVFCGRNTLIDEFDRLLDPDEGLEVLVAFSEGKEKLGRTRLLHELAARALRAGHVVVMVDDRWRDTSRLPQTPAQLTAALARAIVETRRRFGMGKETPDAILELLEEATGERAAREDGQRFGRLGPFLSRCEAADANEAILRAGLADALAKDLERLAADARELEGAAVRPDARVLVVLGGLGYWGTALELLLGELLGANGLGRRESPIPVLASCSLADPGGEFVKQAMQATRGTQWILYEPLTQLGDREETLACQWVLLHPWRRDVEGSRKAYTPAPGVPTSGPAWEAPFKRLVGGVPGQLADPFFYSIAIVQEEHGMLVGADDDDVLRTYAGAEEAP